MRNWLFVLLFIPTVCFSDQVTVRASWDKVTTRVDGSTLDNLKGYELYWADASGSAGVVDLSANETARDFTVDATGSLTIQIAAFDADGLMSELSDPAIINLTPPGKPNLNSVFVVKVTVEVSQ